MRNIVIIIFLLVTGIPSIAQRDLRNLMYGTHAQHNLDLFLPREVGSETPVLIMLHGGAWSLGGKEYTDKTARDLRDRGFVVANVDYRYVNEKVHAADLLDDIGAAIGYLRSKAPAYGFGTNAFHISGISAGAHLAMLYAYTRNAGLKSVSSLCGPTVFDTTENKNHIEKLELSKVVEWLADSKYESGEAPNEKFTEISPYAKIANIPTLLFHGDRDELVLYFQATAMIRRLQQENVESKLITMHGKGHDCGMNDPESEKLVLDTIEDWVIRHR